MELLTALKQWFQEDVSGRINNVINIAILLALLTTCSRVTDNGREIQQIRQQTQAQLQPVQDEQILKKRVIEMLIQNLNQLDQDKK